MQDLEKECSFLVEKLGAIRKSEIDFTETLRQKYGEGQINPFDLTYQLKNKQNKTDKPIS
jgi:hypothetical protein